MAKLSLSLLVLGLAALVDARSASVLQQRAALPSPSRSAAARLRGGASAAPARAAAAAAVSARGGAAAAARPPSGHMSSLASALSMSKNIIGGGMLALAWGMAAGKGTGWLPAFGVLGGSCAASAYTFYLVGKLVEQTGARDFRSLCEARGSRETTSAPRRTKKEPAA